MKKSTQIVFRSLFVFAYAFFFSLGAECVINLFALGFALTLDSNPRYPRFVPFCFVMGIFALLCLVVIAILNFKKWEELEYTVLFCKIQTVLVLAASVPMIKAWHLLFVFLQDML